VVHALQAVPYLSAAERAKAAAEDAAAEEARRKAAADDSADRALKQVRNSMGVPDTFML
jgi:phage protein D